ncbi:hypothetical protein Tco_0532579 [Tanacetum coccineum]
MPTISFLSLSTGRLMAHVITMNMKLLEGQCYSISNFAITENNGKLPLLLHKYKISFYKGTIVTRIDPFDNNVNGFILEPFNWLLDGTHHYHEHEAVGTPTIHNALFGTKMFINRDVPEILAFRQRVKELPEYDESQFKIEVFTPQEAVVTIVEVFHGALKKMVASIREYSIKRMGGHIPPARNATGKRMLWRVKLPHLWVKARLPFTVKSMVQIRLHPELDKLVGKNFMFKLYHSQYNMNNNNYTYMCDAFNDDPETIKHFKASFLEDSLTFEQDYTMDGYNKLIYVIHDETSYNKDQLREQHVRLYDSLTSEQKGIYSTVMDAVDKHKGGMFFVYGTVVLERHTFTRPCRLPYVLKVK